MPKYQHDDFGDVQDHIFAKGIITAVDNENDTADVTVEGYESGSDTPLFYHCEPDSEEKPKMVFLRNPPRYPLWKREYRLLF